MPAVKTRVECLTFDEVGAIPDIPLNTPAWECQSYAALTDAPPALGEDRHIPGLPGRLFMPREFDEGQVPLRIVVFGAADMEGTPYDDPREGVRANLRFLRANLLLPQDALRAVTFERLDGGEETGNVVVVPPFQPVMLGPSNARIMLNLLIPDGMLTETSS